MNKISLQAKARELAKVAQRATSGRAADTIVGGHEKRLRQTAVALRRGAVMNVQSASGEATLLVITGRLWLRAENTKWFGREWSHLVIPDGPFTVESETDTTFLLTVALSRTMVEEDHDLTGEIAQTV
ncbi:MAG TPA: LuxR family transcriptional regulator [Beutenbergiaceae bacterium]|nr:LuxR family transcriptional regulator [Beutenbergiaceae bacterium]